MEKMEELSKLEEYRDVYPDTITYSSVISAFARSGRDDAGCRAEELLERSINLYHDGKVNLRPDSMTFCSVLDALAKESQFDHKFPSRKSSITRAEEVFERMKQMHRSGNSSVRPNTVAYNILIGMYATAKKVKDAEKLFQEMHSSHSLAKPDLITYNSYLYALANSNSKENIERAISLLNDMESAVEGDAFIRPDTSSYMSVMKALAKKSKQDPSAINDMENILRAMEQRYMKGVTTAKPINVFYNCYIDALAKSGSDDAFDLALETIDHMKKMSKNFLNIAII
jgi:pentatricopeptide repeat protein